MASTPLLQIVARISPAVWDAVVPRHRLAEVGSRLPSQVPSRIDLVSLNPQPLPPAERFLVASADLAHDIGRLAVETDLTHGGGTDLVRQLVDDWCGTGWPRRWPFPFPGPDPRGDAFDLAGGRLVGAVVLASLGQRMADSELGAAFTEGAERLAEVALQG